MVRVWFNKNFSSLSAAIRLIRESDKTASYQIVCTSTNLHAPTFLFAHSCSIEPSGLKGEEYVSWCLDFCCANSIGIFVPGKEASLISGVRQRFEERGTRVLCAASQGMLDLLHDKALFYQSVKCNTPPAAFRVVETALEFNDAYRELRADHAKLCIKPSVSVYGLGFSVIDEKRSSAQLNPPNLSRPFIAL